MTSGKTAGSLMIVAAFTFLCASVIHFGAAISLLGATFSDPFQGAAIPEMIIAIVVGLGAIIALMRRRASWAVALAAVSFALLGVIYGLTVTLRDGRVGDISYHFGVLALLLITLVFLLVPTTREDLRPRA